MGSTSVLKTESQRSTNGAIHICDNELPISNNFQMSNRISLGHEVVVQQILTIRLHSHVKSCDGAIACSCVHQVLLQIAHQQFAGLERALDIPLVVRQRKRRFECPKRQVSD